MERGRGGKGKRKGGGDHLPYFPPPLASASNTTLYRPLTDQTKRCNHLEGLQNSYSRATHSRYAVHYLAIPGRSRPLLATATLLAEFSIIYRLVGFCCKPYCLMLSLHCALSIAAQCIVIGPVCGGRTTGRPAVSAPYYSQLARSVCVSLSAFFIINL